MVSCNRPTIKCTLAEMKTGKVPNHGCYIKQLKHLGRPTIQTLIMYTVEIIRGKAWSVL